MDLLMVVLRQQELVKKDSAQAGGDQTDVAAIAKSLKVKLELSWL